MMKKLHWRYWILPINMIDQFLKSGSQKAIFINQENDLKMLLKLIKYLHLMIQKTGRDIINRVLFNIIWGV